MLDSNAGIDKETLNKLLKDAKEADREDKIRKQVFEGMIGTVAWGYYARLLDLKLQGFSEVLLAPAGSMDGMVRHEFVKGAMFGLALARDLPHVIIASMKDQLPSRDESEENE